MNTAKGHEPAVDRCAPSLDAAQENAPAICRRGPFVGEGVGPRLVGGAYLSTAQGLGEGRLHVPLESVNRG